MAPLLDVDSGRQHVLALPGEVGPEVVEILARSRFPRAAWQAAVAAARRSGSPGTRGRPTPVAVLRLSRLSTVLGPYTVDRDMTTQTGLPTGTAYLIDAPVERGGRPWSGGGDRNGLRRAFPEGLPVRDEARVLDWAIAVARRLGGAVRTAGPHGFPGVLLTPDPAAAVDLTVWSDLWLDPEAVLAVMRRALPRAYLNLPTGRWAGPPPGTGEHVVPGAEVLTSEQRTALHAAADAFDRAALENPAPLQAFGALADLDLDGMIALEVSGETTLPPVVASLPWAARGAVAYRVRWEAADLYDLESERPSLQHRVARRRAAPLVVAVARAVHAKVRGEITDMMDFVVDPADL